LASLSLDSDFFQGCLSPLCLNDQYQRKESARSGATGMTNQYQILTGEAPPDLIDAAAGAQNSAVMLYAGGSDSGAYPKAPQDFEPSLHVMLMSTYWRQPQACPEQPSAIAATASDSPGVYYTPESWLEFRKI
jgi:hypothetical protein